MTDDPAVLLVGAGRKPGTSTNVTSGTLNASHVRTNRAAFSDASMSSVPARFDGWLPDDADRMAVDAGEPAHDVAAHSALTSKNSPSSTTSAITFFMS